MRNHQSCLMCSSCCVQINVAKINSIDCFAVQEFSFQYNYGQCLLISVKNSNKQESSVKNQSNSEKAIEKL